MDTKQYFSVYHPWHVSFLQQHLLHFTGSRRSRHIYNYYLMLSEIAVFFLPFLLFLTLQLEPPKRQRGTRAPSLQQKKKGNKATTPHPPAPTRAPPSIWQAPHRPPPPTQPRYAHHSPSHHPPRHGPTCTQNSNRVGGSNHPFATTTRSTGSRAKGRSSTVSEAGAHEAGCRSERNGTANPNSTNPAPRTRGRATPWSSAAPAPSETSPLRTRPSGAPSTPGKSPQNENTACRHDPHSNTQQAILKPPFHSLTGQEPGKKAPANPPRGH